jgi:hypothetical protein
MRNAILATTIVFALAACGRDEPPAEAAAPAPEPDPRTTAQAVAEDLPVVTDTDPHVDTAEPAALSPAPWSGDKLAAAATRGPYA